MPSPRDPHPPWAGTQVPSWHERGVCRQVATAIFFDEKYEPLAKRVCSSCPVRNECRAWALDAGSSLHGVWGGLSWWDRQKLRRAQRRQAEDGAA